MRESEEVRVVFMGDSITEGQYVEPTHRWTDLAAAEMVVEASSRGWTRLRTFNKGISGQTTRQGLERFPNDVQALCPQVMILQFGLNDCNYWDSDRGLPRVSIAAYRANLVEMISRARKFGANEIVLSTNHPTLRRAVLAGGVTLEQSRIVYNDVVRKVAEETAATLCDIDQEFSGLSDTELEMELLPAPDLLHLSHKGHKRYCNAILPFVVRAVEKTLATRETI